MNHRNTLVISTPSRILRHAGYVRTEANDHIVRPSRVYRGYGARDPQDFFKDGSKVYDLSLRQVGDKTVRASGMAGGENMESVYICNFRNDNKDGKK